MSRRVRSALKLRERREALGLSQQDVAKRAGIPDTQVAHVERGTGSPPTRQMVETAMAELAAENEASTRHEFGL